MYLLGKILEAIGMALVGAGLLHGMAVEGGLGVELRLFGVGAVVFIIGWLVEKSRRPSS